MEVTFPPWQLTFLVMLWHLVLNYCFQHCPFPAPERVRLGSSLLAVGLPWWPSAPHPLWALLRAVSHAGLSRWPTLLLSWGQNWFRFIVLGMKRLVTRVTNTFLVKLYK